MHKKVICGCLNMSIPSGIVFSCTVVKNYQTFWLNVTSEIVRMSSHCQTMGTPVSPSTSNKPLTTTVTSKTTTKSPRSTIVSGPTLPPPTIVTSIRTSIRPLTPTTLPPQTIVTSPRTSIRPLTPTLTTSRPATTFQTYASSTMTKPDVTTIRITSIGSTGQTPHSPMTPPVSCAVRITSCIKIMVTFILLRILIGRFHRYFSD